MLEKVLKGNPLYWAWAAVLAILVGLAGLTYLFQLFLGLEITNLSRDVPWGFYIANFAFLEGVCASVMIMLLAYYVHGHSDLARLTLLAEFMAFAAMVMTLLLVVVDIARPDRMLNTIFFAAPNSMLFWDMVGMNGFLFLILIMAWGTLGNIYREMPEPAWQRPLAKVVIVVALGIGCITAFLYAGLPGRSYLLTAILAPRFLVAGFAAGSALLILLVYLIRRLADFDMDPSGNGLKLLTKVMTYSLILHVFFFLMEIFTAGYSAIPSHLIHFQYLYLGYEGYNGLVPFMWIAVLAALTAFLLLYLRTRGQCCCYLVFAAILTLVATWIDKALGTIGGGFVPNPMHEVTEYFPGFVEWMITLGIIALGLLIFTGCVKVMISVLKSKES